jgi:hypothetical protein
VTRRHLGTAAAAAAAAALLLTGCAGSGGGGGSADAQGDVPPPASAGVPVASGADASQSASLAIAALNNPGAVGANAAGGTLSAYDSFGRPHDAFAQQVDESDASGSEPSAGQAPAMADTPINGDALVAVPGATGSIPTAPSPTDGTGSATDPNAGVPVQNPKALEADFDVSGEPVVAREGDAIPPETQQFIVKTISSKEVVLELSGGLLPDGSDTVTLKEGQSITLYNATARHGYRIKLVDVRAV